jgi:energy-coupling factor transporter transmembrane protein EcfT
MHAEIKTLTMSKKALILFFLCTCITLAHAQTFIPKAGLTITTLNAKDFVKEMDNNIKSQTGFVIGVAYTIPVGTVGKGIFSVQPELSFIQKGFKVDATGDFSGSESAYYISTQQEYKINYLEIPVLAKYEFGSDLLRFAIHAGPSLAFGLNGSYKSKMHIMDDFEYDETTDTKGDIRFYDSDETNTTNFDHNIDFGLQGGAGVTIAKHIVFDVRYGMSLTNLNHQEKSKNRVLQFTVGVPIHFN